MTRLGNNLQSPANGNVWLVQALSEAIIVVAIVMTVVAVPAYSQGGASPPRVVLEKPRYDFGETFAGEDLSHAFWVRNLGTTVLELSDKPLLTTRPAKAFATESFQAPWKLLPVKATTGAPPPT